MALTPNTVDKPPSVKGTSRDRNLAITTALNLLITLAELTGGLVSGSLALLSDALHNAGDTLAVFFSYLSLKIGARKPTQNKTFGYRRAEILTALFNAVILITVSVFLMVEAMQRLNTPQPIDGPLMLTVALVGLAANLAGVFLLNPHKHGSLNIRSAWLHLIGDTLSSMAVVAGGVAIILWDIYWIDPVITFAVAFYLIKESWQIISDTIHILMQGTPKGLDQDTLVQAITLFPLVDNVHHIHLWSLDDQTFHMEAHIRTKQNIPLDEADNLRYLIEQKIRNQFGIKHFTFQMEHLKCNTDNSE